MIHDHELEEKIKELAYHKWEEAGKPENMEAHFWLEAEKEIIEYFKSLYEPPSE